MNALQDKRTRQLLVVSSCLFGSAALIFGSVLIRANINKGQTTPLRAGKPRWGLVASSAELNATLTQTLALREKWRPWATEHQSELRRLMHEPQNQPQSLQELRDLVPAAPRYTGTGFMPKDLSGNGISFASWTAGHDFAPQKDDSALVTRRYEQSLLRQNEFQQRNYKMYRDIAVLTSTTNGPVHYTFWASGRITESTISIENRQNQQNPFLNAQEKELAPPFDFLGG